MSATITDTLYPADTDSLPSQTGTAECADCGDEFPVYEGATDTDANGQPICVWCHAQAIGLRA